MNFDEKAGAVGVFHALQMVLRALVLTHPNMPALMAEMASEHHSSMSALLGSELPDAAIEAYKESLSTIGLNPDDWIEGIRQRVIDSARQKAIDERRSTSPFVAVPRRRKPRRAPGAK